MLCSKYVPKRGEILMIYEVSIDQIDIISHLGFLRELIRKINIFFGIVLATYKWLKVFFLQLFIGAKDF